MTMVGPTMPSHVATRTTDELLRERRWTCRLTGSDSFSVETFAQIREERKNGGESALAKWTDGRMREAFARAIEPKLTIVEQEINYVVHRAATVWVFTETEIRALVAEAYLRGAGQKTEAE